MRNNLGVFLVYHGILVSEFKRSSQGQEEPGFPDQHCNQNKQEPFVSIIFAFLILIKCLHVSEDMLVFQRHPNIPNKSNKTNNKPNGYRINTSVSSVIPAPSRLGSGHRDHRTSMVRPCRALGSRLAFRRRTRSVPSSEPGDASSWSWR